MHNVIPSNLRALSKKYVTYKKRCRDGDICAVFVCPVPTPTFCGFWHCHPYIPIHFRKKVLFTCILMYMQLQTCCRMTRMYICTCTCSYILLVDKRHCPMYSLVESDIVLSPPLALSSLVSNLAVMYLEIHNSILHFEWKLDTHLTSCIFDTYICI